MGNQVAHLMLLIWPLLAIYLFLSKPVRDATILIVLLSFLLLPVKTEIDLPLFPPYGKNTAAIYCLILLFLFLKRKVEFFSNNTMANLLVVTILVSPFFTYISNTEAFYSGERYFKGLTIHDGFSMMFTQLFGVLSFFFGRQFIKTLEDQIALFKIVVASATIYSVLVLLEIRIAPQLHTKIYGYFPHMFIQQIRGDGYRAVVFIGHGLEVSFFLTIAALSSMILWKAKSTSARTTVSNQIKQLFEKKNFFGFLGSGIIVLYLYIVLYLSKSLAALIYATVGILILKLFSPRKVLIVSMLLALIAMSYPMSKSLNLFPQNEILNIAESVNVDRAQSLEFRFDNEDILLERAQEKLLFGWGGWARSRVYSESGKDLSVTDGTWIIILGQNGILSFLAVFGLMFWTLLRAKKAHLFIKNNVLESNLLVGHCYLVAIIMIDQIPNSSLVPIYWLIIGGLAGRTEHILAKYK